MKIEVINQKRKTYSLKLLDENNAVLKVPIRASQKDIDGFLSEKRSWIEKSAKKLSERSSFGKSFDFEKYIYLDGSVIGEMNQIVLGYDKMNQQQKERAIKKYYLSNFNVLERLARETADRYGMTFDSVKPTTSTRIWGSFSSKRVMKLNWKLVILPINLAYYVICHELSHSKHFNHSPMFWAEVQKMCPEYKRLRKELQMYGFLLK
ncbi:MAG: DUF45 domain-containing protein [Clostridia bacterium]|nr:DUF45 domain-containing protein [Clostridia bacterium]